ncbi:hypothetical protein LTR56_007469 [Elasticomyces elasticus]|nr:hypothetical protein LTR56_007469 [Elasticomyces elasticus]KAK3668209.1 hypothetical protein LTR22_000894 [Elasticomyces elasticus]KAK4921346.1 hypothetical protein LTR49_011176 [Elasticomyces elasticus]KAK5769465.1 hypothetical protein LTS12_000392 [Elasticomyces elasticus]
METVEHTWTSYVQTLIAQTQTAVQPGLTFTGIRYAQASGCTRSDESTTTSTTDGYPVTIETPFCPELPYNTTVVYTVSTYTDTWTATYALSTGSALSTLSEEWTETWTSTACDYQIAPPTCTLSDGPYSGACTLGPDCNDCTIYGGTVQLLYFPVTTDTLALPNATTVFNVTRTSLFPAASTTVFHDKTLTSPSVYISFATVYAVNDCGSTVGRAHTGSILALDIDDLSSADGNTHARVTDTSLLAQGVTRVSLYAMPFKLANLNWPYAPWAWAQQAQCNAGIAQICPIILSGQYNPVLAVPTQIRILDPLWSTCAMDLVGLYDPPRALQPVANAASATVPVAASPSTTPAAAASAPTSPGASTTSAQLAWAATTLAVSSSHSASNSALTSVVAESTISQLLTGQQPAQDTQISDNARTTSTSRFAQSDGPGDGNPTSVGADSNRGPAASLSASDDNFALSIGGTVQTLEVSPSLIATVGSEYHAVTIMADAFDSTQVVAQSAGGSTTLRSGNTGRAGGQTFFMDSSGNIVVLLASTIDLGDSSLHLHTVHKTPISLEASNDRISTTGGSSHATTSADITTTLVPGLVAIVDKHTFSRVLDTIVVDGKVTIVAGSSATIDGTVFSVNPNGRLIVEGRTTFLRHETRLSRLMAAIEGAATVSAENTSPDLQLGSTSTWRGTSSVLGGVLDASASSPTPAGENSAGSLMFVGRCFFTLAISVVAISALLFA